MIGAATTHFVEHVSARGLGGIPWNLIVWAVPGAIIGAQIGSRPAPGPGVPLELLASLFLGIGGAFRVTTARQAGLA